MSALLRLSACLLCAFVLPTANADTSCNVVNLMPAFWQALQSSDASKQLHATVIDPHPDLYNADYVSVPSGAKWDDRLARERTYVDTHRAEVTAVTDYLSKNVPRYMTEFAQTFDDYRCDFTFYIAPSFGGMDGAAAFINGEHRIIFAPDVIPRYHALAGLKALVDHETFHIYHHQATDVFGATAEAMPTVLNALWSEGLATFVSRRMNPDASLDVVLLQPGIPEGAQPHLADIAKDLLAHLDEKDETTYGHYFMANRQPAGYPPRAGYYMGMLIAQRLSQDYTLVQLAHLKGPALHAAIVAELESFRR